METVYQSLGFGTRMPSRYKRPDVSLSDRLFIAAVGNLPSDQRPWGSITWLSEVFGISRPTVYSIAEQARQRLWAELVGRAEGTVAVASSPVGQPGEAASGPTETASVPVTDLRIQRTLLTLAVPGNMAIRPMQAVLQAAFDQTRSIGFISELITTAGQKAGQVLAGLDYRPLGQVIALRDETFLQDQPILFVVDPRTSVILLGHVAEDRSAETWGAALLVAQDCGAQIVGLVEDMGRTFPQSLQLADLQLPVQKDPWHVQRWAGCVRRELERAALNALATVYRLEEQLLQQWDDDGFEGQYVPAVAKADHLIAAHDTFAEWQAHLSEALEVVDWRSGEIRERTINGWLLDETLKALSTIDHPGVRQLVRSLRRFRHQLLTYLDWLAEWITPWRQRLATVLPDPTDQTFFERTVARTWRLRQGVINGRRWQRPAAEAADLMGLLVADQAAYRQLADDLFAILDGAAHTTSLIETINGLLKAFLLARQAFHSRETAQAYLNLLVLWHNMRVFQRGKRAGKSPFQWASITTESDDWLTLLSYPAAA
jgi:hypothetical protein